MRLKKSKYFALVVLSTCVFCECVKFASPNFFINFIKKLNLFYEINYVALNTKQGFRNGHTCSDLYPGITPYCGVLQELALGLGTFQTSTDARRMTSDKSFVTLLVEFVSVLVCLFMPTHNLIKKVRILSIFYVDHLCNCLLGNIYHCEFFSLKDLAHSIAVHGVMEICS